MQKTLNKNITIQGIGLHSGLNSSLLLKPAPINFGVVFKRIDLPSQPEIAALYSNVADTRNCTCLGDQADNRVSTIEHLMAALYAAEIDNVLIEANNLELPIMDSSAAEFYRQLTSLPLTTQSSPRRQLQILQEVSYKDDDGAFVSLRPRAEGLYINFDIDFPSPIVGHQHFASEITPTLFAQEIAPCRTFCEKHQVDYLYSIGLIKGGSLENAVVLDGDKLLNPEGFRTSNECIKHKVLDAIGDLYTSGYRIIGEYIGSRSGHRHTNELLKKLFADPANYRII